MDGWLICQNFQTTSWKLDEVLSEGVVNLKNEMKRKIFLLAISFMLFNFANAQFVENNAVYAT